MLGPRSSPGREGVSLPLPWSCPLKMALPGTKPVREEVAVQVLYLSGVLLGSTRLWMSFLVCAWYQASSHSLSHLLGACVHSASHLIGCLATTCGRDPQIEKDLAANLPSNPPPDYRGQPHMGVCKGGCSQPRTGE